MYGDTYRIVTYVSRYISYRDFCIAIRFISRSSVLFLFYLGSILLLDIPISVVSYVNCMLVVYISLCIRQGTDATGSDVQRDHAGQSVTERRSLLPFPQVR